MGVAITELLTGKEISIGELQGKILAVDAFNLLYQFLTTIRMRDGTPLKDSKGNVTGHLIGLFSRTTALMAEGLRLCFVFDGKPPKLKKRERERRAAVKAQALQQYKAAEANEDIAGMKKYAGRTAKLTGAMIDEAKELLAALGLPVIQAPSEGEAQAAHLCKKGEAYAVVSQDADSFLFGAPRVVKNLNLAGRRKKTSTLAYEKVSPALLTLEENLKALGLEHDQLIALAILVGTDYDKEGIRGIGPKKALKLVTEHGTDYDALFKAVEWNTHYPELDWKILMDAFRNVPATDDYALSWKAPDEDALRKLLVDRHDFSGERVTSTLAKLQDTHRQKGLGEFL